MRSRASRSGGLLSLRIATAFVLLAAIALLVPPKLAAQQPSGAARDAASEGERGFLFERPRVTLALRSGLLFHRAGSDIFAFAEERFTLDQSDFRAITLGLEGTVWFDDHFEGTAAIEGSRVTLNSESRSWLEEDGSPIRQSTRLSSGPSLALGARYFLFERGESLGQLVWIPRKWNLFVGAGAGVIPYEFKQWGDFVNESTEVIFTDDVNSKGVAPMAYLSGGTSLQLSLRSTFLLEGRYQWGKTDLERHFTGFEPIDLAGLRTTLSLGYNF